GNSGNEIDFLSTDIDYFFSSFFEYDAQRLGASRRFLACVKPKFEDSPEGLCLTCEAPSRSEGSPKGFPRYVPRLCTGRGFYPEMFFWKRNRSRIRNLSTEDENPVWRIADVGCWAFIKRFRLLIYTFFVSVKRLSKLQRRKFCLCFK